MISINSFIENKNRIPKAINIDSVFIEQDGIIEHHYFQQEGLHLLRSVSKTITAMAVGIAIEKRMKIKGNPITLSTKVYPIIEDLVDITGKENLNKIKKWTLHNLLTHTTGYKEQMMSDKMVQDIDKDKLLGYALNYEMPYEVGTRYAYNNLEPFIVSVLFKEGFNIDLDDFVNENIFIKLGITNYKWEKYGKYCPGATGLSLSHKDFHKIGQLLLNNGQFNEIQVIPESWIVEMCSLKVDTPNYYKPERVLPKLGAGYFTFISRDGFVFRDGADGQYLIVNYGRKLLISIMSSESDMGNVTEPLRGLI